MTKLEKAMRNSILKNFNASNMVITNNTIEIKLKDFKAKKYCIKHKTKKDRIGLHSCPNCVK